MDKNEICYLHFHIKQKFNPRTINKLDKYGNNITLVSLGFPYQSKFKGCYISVNAAFIKDDKFHKGVRQQISLLANAPFKIWKYDKELKEAIEITTLLGKDVVKEFDSWKQNDREEQILDDIDKEIEK